MIEKSRLLQLRTTSFILMIGFSLLSSCSYDENGSVKEDNVNDDYAPFSDSVIDEQGEIINLDILEKFVKNVEEGEQDKVRIVRYTTEGDPIILDLEFDTEKIVFTNDTTRDQYGDGGVDTTTCKSITKNNTANGTEYELSECNNADGNFDIFVVKK